MANFIMMVGISGSGKSSYAQEIPYTEVVSSDAVRAELYGDESIQGDPRKVFNIVHSRVKALLREDKNVVYDATNLNAKRRAAFLRSLKNEGIKCRKWCYVVMTPWQICVARRSQGMGVRETPPDVVARQVRQFQLPQYGEGWDKIELMRGFGHLDNVDIYEPAYIMEMFCKVSHDNHHHTLSIYDHCATAAKLIEGSAESQLLYDVGFYHDIGKFFTKRFANVKGELAEEAHYYGHDNVGAYILATWAAMYKKEWRKNYWYLIACCANYHMTYRFMKEEKRAEFEKKADPTFINALKKLVVADGLAH